MPSLTNEGEVMIVYHENFDVIKNVKSNAIIAHGVNCLGVMGAGIALQIKNTYPRAFKDYVDFIKSSEDSPLGCVSISCVDQENQLYIANCFTQENVGFRNGKPPATISDIGCSLGLAADFAYTMQLEIWMPKIGCGLGGLDWERVKPIIEEISETLCVNINMCTL